jgi:hypothetical protein
LVASGFTTLCCLGITAALSLATSLGATFLTRDSSLRPILILTLTVTALGSLLTYRRDRDTIFPLIMTVASGAWIFTILYGIDFTEDTSHSSAHGDGSSATNGSHALGNSQQALVWVGLAFLVGAQIWDVLRVRTKQRALTEGAP